MTTSPSTLRLTSAHTRTHAASVVLSPACAVSLLRALYTDVACLGSVVRRCRLAATRRLALVSPHPACLAGGPCAASRPSSATLAAPSTHTHRHTRPGPQRCFSCGAMAPLRRALLLLLPLLCIAGGRTSRTSLLAHLPHEPHSLASSAENRPADAQRFKADVNLKSKFSPPPLFRPRALYSSRLL